MKLSTTILHSIYILNFNFRSTPSSSTTQAPTPASDADATSSAVQAPTPASGADPTSSAVQAFTLASGFGSSVANASVSSVSASTSNPIQRSIKSCMVRDDVTKAELRWIIFGVNSKMSNTVFFLC